VILLLFSFFQVILTIVLDCNILLFVVVYCGLLSAIEKAAWEDHVQIDL